MLALAAAALFVVVVEPPPLFDPEGAAPTAGFAPPGGDALVILVPPVHVHVVEVHPVVIDQLGHRGAVLGPQREAQSQKVPYKRCQIVRSETNMVAINSCHVSRYFSNDSQPLIWPWLNASPAFCRGLSEQHRTTRSRSEIQASTTHPPLNK